MLIKAKKKSQKNKYEKHPTKNMYNQCYEMQYENDASELSGKLKQIDKSKK